MKNKKTCGNQVKGSTFVKQSRSQMKKDIYVQQRLTKVNKG